MLLFEDIIRAEKIVSKHIVTTPVVHSQALSKAIGEHIYLKLENRVGWLWEYGLTYA